MVKNSGPKLNTLFMGWVSTRLIVVCDLKLVCAQVHTIATGFCSQVGWVGSRSVRCYLIRVGT